MTVQPAGQPGSVSAPADVPVRPGPIDNPVINSPFVEPTASLQGRRRPGGGRHRAAPPAVSEFFVPVAKPKKSAAQLALEFGVRRASSPTRSSTRSARRSARWRLQGYPHTTPITKELLAHWRAEDRDRRLFFCQIEAAETAIYLTEAADKLGDTKALNVIRAENARLNDGLPRLAFKMATGSGKTRRDGDAHRLAGAQQARRPVRQAVRPPASSSSRPGSPSATASGSCCPTIPRPSTGRWTSSRRSSSTASRRRRSRSPTTTPSSGARRTRPRR